MNRLFILTFWLYSIAAFSQVVSIPSSQKACDMVYDSISDRIYITIPTSDTINGNSIGIVNPYTNTLESTLFVGDNPTEMAISDNEQYIYVAFDGVAKIKKYTLNPLAYDSEFELGAEPAPSTYGNYYARDIAVMPGQPNIIAVSRKVIANVTPDNAGIGIYENGVMRPQDYISGINITKIKFKDSNTLIGHAGNMSSAGTTLFNVNTNGISFVSDHQGVPNPHPYLSTSDFIYRENKLYFMNGRRVDISSTPILDGQYGSNVFGGGGVMYDELNNLLCFSDSSNSNTFYQGGFWDGNIKRYNPVTLQLFDSQLVTTAGEVDKMISCGANCYSLLTKTTSPSQSRLTIARPQTLNLNKNSLLNNIIIYPNPSSSIFYLKNHSNITITEIVVYDSFGKSLLRENTDKLDLSSFANGIYFCKIHDANRNFVIKKILKL